MSKFLVGQLVRVGNNAFAASTHEEDRQVRGRTGTIRQCHAGISPTARQPLYGEYYRVDVESLGLYFLKESELEALE